MPKMSEFSCLGTLRLRCVRTAVSRTKPFSLKGMIRGFIPKEFEVMSQSPLSRSGFPKAALTTGFLNTFWRSFFGQRNADNSTNRDRNQISIKDLYSK